jgi:hypothetical protein
MGKLRVNREARIVLIHAWYMREKRRARCRAWKKANLKKARAIVRNWRKVNPERVRAIVCKWIKANPEKAKNISAVASLKKQSRFKYTPLTLRKVIVAAREFAKEINDVKINRKSRKSR